MAKNLSQLDSLCQHLEELGAVDKIEQLQEHENQQVYRVSQKIIDEFFGSEVGTSVCILNHCICRCLIKFVLHSSL